MLTGTRITSPERRSRRAHAVAFLTPMVLFTGVWTGQLAPVLVAQEPPPGLVEVKESGRHGLWLGLGLGAGGESNDFIGGAGYSNLFYQPILSLRVGGTVSPHLRLGGEILS